MNPEIEDVVVKRFLNSGETVEQIALEFGVPAGAVRASIGHAVQAALNRGAPSAGAALQPVPAPPTGWFDQSAPDDPEPRSAEPAEVERKLEAVFPPVAESDGPAEANPASHGEGGADPIPPAELVESAMRSVANGTPLESVARYFNVSEADLRSWLDETDSVQSAVQPDEIIDTPAKMTDPPEPVANPTNERKPIEPVTAVRPSPATRKTTPVYSPDRAVVRGRRSNPPSSMSLRDALQMLRRRSLVVLVLAMLGMAGGWLSAPGKSTASVSYRATNTLIYEARDSQSYNIDQAALLATSGDVPSRVAARLHLSRSQVRSAVSAVAKADVSTIAITARNALPAVAAALADTTAEELAVEIDGNILATYQSELSRLTGLVDAAQKRLATIPAKDAATQASARADLDAAQRALRQFQETSPPPKSQLRTLEKASAAAVAPAGVRAPDSKPVRALVLGFFGLLLGAAGAFVFERLDTRIRSKKAAEDAFGAPVIAEVPPMTKSSDGELLTVTQPTSPFVEAYRGLRTYVALWAPEADREDGHRVIVVTSPAPGEGKTTTVAHLAAMLAEIGRSVVVVSADLRRPRLHLYFGRSEAPGLMNALTAPGQPVFAGLDQTTSVRGVRLVSSGPATENPAPMIEHAGALLESVRGLADFVLVDSPPLLVASDSVELARHADGVLLVSRAGKTPLDAAEHCAELLDRLEIPVVGAVLVGSEEASSASRYYSSRYYAEPDRSGRHRRRSASGSGQNPVPEAQSPVASEETSPASGQ